MSFIIPADFIGEVNIPNTGDTYLGTNSNVQYFIDKYEPQFLESLLGSDLYAQYVAGIAADPVDPKWTNIQTMTKSSLLNYIWYWFKRDQYTYSSSTGEAQARAENANMVSPAFKMQTRWNEMVKYVYKLVKNWDVDTYGKYYIDFGIFRIYDLEFDEFYPFFYARCHRRYPDIFYTINTYGI